MTEFTIPAMTCGHCIGRVTKAVQQVDPAARVTVDLPAHTVQVESGAEREELVAALAEAGYAPA